MLPIHKAKKRESNLELWERDEAAASDVSFCLLLLRPFAIIRDSAHGFFGMCIRSTTPNTAQLRFLLAPVRLKAGPAHRLYFSVTNMTFKALQTAPAYISELCIRQR